MTTNERGCLHYVHTTVSIYFDPEHFDCAHCPLLETYARKQCRRTGEYIIDDRLTGAYCPLMIQEDDNG
mgnify:CR=1 FL=1